MPLDFDEETVSVKDYVDALIRERTLLVEDKEKSQIRQVEATREALQASTLAADNNLMVHITNQREENRLALSALKELLGEKDKSVEKTATALEKSQEEFRAHMEARLRILNDHKAQMIGLTASFVTKDMHSELRDLALKLEASTIENGHQIASMRGGEGELTSFRLRVDALELRPVAMTPEEQGEAKAALGEAGRDIVRIRQDIHDLRGIVNAMKTAPTQFQPNEVDDIRRLMRTALKAAVVEPFTDAEVKSLRRFLAHQAKKEQTWFGMSRELLMLLLGVVFLIFFTAIWSYIRVKWFGLPA